MKIITFQNFSVENNVYSFHFKLSFKKRFSKTKKVLITDYFDESMVLLKEELCWETEDISYLKSNSRNTQDSQSVRNWLGEEYAKKLLEWNKADWKLYRHFNETFTQKV